MRTTKPLHRRAVVWLARALVLAAVVLGSAQARAAYYPVLSNFAAPPGKGVYVLMFEGTTNHPFKNPSGVSELFNAMKSPAAIIGGPGNEIDTPGVIQRFTGSAFGTSMDRRSSDMVEVLQKAHDAGHRDFVVIGFSRGGETQRRFIAKAKALGLSGARFGFWEMDGVPGRPRRGTELPGSRQFSWWGVPRALRSANEARLTFNMTRLNHSVLKNLKLAVNHTGASNSNAAMNLVTRWLAKKKVELNTRLIKRDSTDPLKSNGGTGTTTSGRFWWSPIWRWSGYRPRLKFVPWARIPTTLRVPVSLGGRTLFNALLGDAAEVVDVINQNRPAIPFLLAGARIYGAKIVPVARHLGGQAMRGLGGGAVLAAPAIVAAGFVKAQASADTQRYETYIQGARMPIPRYQKSRDTAYDLTDYEKRGRWLSWLWDY